MASDRVLINATNETFWQITGYKRGQRLDMSIPQDFEMAKRWRSIYAELQQHKTRALQAAQALSADRHIPFVMVVERKDPNAQFGNLLSTVYETRNSLMTQYQWGVDQTDFYSYIAAYDFTVDPNGPVMEQFAVLERLRSGAMTSGWPRYH
jgi:hypothetical protein